MRVEYYCGESGGFPVQDFLNNLESSYASKVYFYFTLLAEHNGSLRSPFSKQLEDGIFELRPSKGGKAIRVLYFFDIDKAILTNVFVKKQKKTPRSEIALAKERRANYYARKE